jgi:hypothetical protein
MKINSIIYKKLMAQAEEAKEQGLITLANNILEAIGSFPDEDREQYSYSQLQEDIHRDLWKLSTRLMRYFDVDNVDALKLDRELVIWANNMLDGLEHTLGTSDLIRGPLEPKLPGETE